MRLGCATYSGPVTISVLVMVSKADQLSIRLIKGRIECYLLYRDKMAIVLYQIQTRQRTSMRHKSTSMEFVSGTRCAASGRD